METVVGHDRGHGGPRPGRHGSETDVIRSIVLDLMSWKLPEGTAEAVARLYKLQGRVEALVGRKLTGLPKSPALLRNRLLELVEDHFEVGNS